MKVLVESSEKICFGNVMENLPVSIEVVPGDYMTSTTVSISTSCGEITLTEDQVDVMIIKLQEVAKYLEKN